MKLSDFHYELPEELIAHFPPAQRSSSRLLCLDRARDDISHRAFQELPELLKAGDLLVFNDTRVIPARLHGRKASGGRIEALVERILGENEVLAQIRASKSPAPGTELIFQASPDDSDAGQAGVTAEVLARQGGFFHLRFSGPALDILDRIGHIPLPPYIRRPDDASDRERYQTVFARKEGAVAAPTAGLHFDAPLLEALRQRGVEKTFVTLHVGSGTFQPIRVADPLQHRMHSEWIDVSEQTCEQVEACRARGGRVIAVGTTSVRCLESAALRAGAQAKSASGAQPGLKPCQGETDIFIYPGHHFQVVEGMITNFHLPESTLMMLVSAFAGRERILEAYRRAVQERYRFFSYGDAMLLL